MLRSTIENTLNRSRQNFALYLLKQGRLDDAYSFCRYRYSVRRQEREAKEMARPAPGADSLDHNSQPGDWIYPREPGCRFNDVFADIAEEDIKSLSPQLAVSLWMIKLNVIQIYMTIKPSIECFGETECGRMLHGVEGPEMIVIKYLAGDERAFETWDQSFEIVMESQWKQFDMLTRVLRESFPIIFSSISDRQMTARCIEEDRFEMMCAGQHVDALIQCLPDILNVPFLKTYMREFNRGGIERPTFQTVARMYSIEVEEAMQL